MIGSGTEHGATGGSFFFQYEDATPSKRENNGRTTMHTQPSIAQVCSRTQLQAPPSRLPASQIQTRGTEQNKYDASPATISEPRLSSSSPAATNWEASFCNLASRCKRWHHVKKIRTVVSKLLAHQRQPIVTCARDIERPSPLTHAQSFTKGNHRPPQKLSTP